MIPASIRVGETALAPALFSPESFFFFFFPSFPLVHQGRGYQTLKLNPMP